MSSARVPNLPRSSGPHTLRHGARPIRDSIHSRAVIDSNGPTALARFCSRNTASPIRSRAGGDSGPKRSRSSGEVNAHWRPSRKNAIEDGLHSSSSPIPSSSYSATMWRSLVKRWW